MSEKSQHIITPHLNPHLSHELENLLIQPQIKAVCSDIDLTLVDISQGHQLGVEGVESILGSAVAEEFNRIFNLILTGHKLPEDRAWDDREAFNGINERIDEIQKNIIPTYGRKYWSKETMLIIACERVGIVLHADLLTQARDAYWQGRKDGAVLYEDTKVFADFLVAHNIFLILMTSSYHIMQIDENMNLSYDPDYSEEYKRRSLQEVLDFPYQELIIGDPIDKPEVAFFDEVYQVTAGIMGISPSELSRTTVFMGDSERNDLSVPKSDQFSSILVTRTLQ